MVTLLKLKTADTVHIPSMTRPFSDLSIAGHGKKAYSTNLAQKGRIHQVHATAMQYVSFSYMHSGVLGWKNAMNFRIQPKLIGLT